MEAASSKAAGDPNVGDKKRRFFEILGAIGVALTAFALGWAIRGDQPPVAKPLTDWQPAARRSGWLPQDQCPAVPLALEFTSPGDGATLRQSWTGSIQSRVAVKLSGSLEIDYTVYIIAHASGSANYYVADRLFENATKTLALPFGVSEPTPVDLWALVVSRAPSGSKDITGDVYTDISKARSLDGFLAISKPITVTILPH